MSKNGITLTAFFFFFAFFWLAMCAWGHSDVTPEQAKEMIDNNDLIIIDVRELSEYCSTAGHIPGALNYPGLSGVLEERYIELPTNEAILVVCQTGGRSNSAADFLDSKGYLHVYDMTGGMNAWTYATVGCVDSDYDGINNDLDNCPSQRNPDQSDLDSDGIGDVCESNSKCPVTTVFGNDSVVSKLLQNYRDTVLSKTPEGRELIKLYYLWSPFIGKAMEQDEEFKEEVKQMIDGVLPMIEDAMR